MIQPIPVALQVGTAFGGHHGEETRPTVDLSLLDGAGWEHLKLLADYARTSIYDRGGLYPELRLPGGSQKNAATWEGPLLTGYLSAASSDEIVRVVVCDADHEDRAREHLAAKGGLLGLAAAGQVVWYGRDGQPCVANPVGRYLHDLCQTIGIWVPLPRHTGAGLSWTLKVEIGSWIADVAYDQSWVVYDADRVSAARSERIASAMLIGPIFAEIPDSGPIDIVRVTAGDQQLYRHFATDLDDAELAVYHALREAGLLPTPARNSARLLHAANV